MKRTQLLTILSAHIFLIAVASGVLITGQASADRDNSRALTNYRNPGFRSPSGSNAVGGGYRSSSVGHGRPHDPYRYDWRQQERNRGIGAGQRAGWQTGYEAGYHGHVHSSTCGIDLYRESLPYQNGFRSGYESAYERGYYAGRAAHEREHYRRYPFGSGFQFHINF